MNTLLDAWNLLAARIHGLEAAIFGFTQTVQYVSIGQQPTLDVQDRLEIANRTLLPTMKECLQEILKFRDTYSGQLSGPVNECITRFDTIAKSALGTNAPGGRHQIQCIVAFVALRSELNYHLSDRESQMIKLVERAFLHLRRRIIADPDFAKQWKTSYQNGGEAACEKLGAVHLLQHGIWSFKAHSEHERTDLILGAPLDMQEADRSADALILTEWKKFDDQKYKPKERESQMQKIAESAVKQAGIYTKSSLAGYEIRSTRYIPIVTEDRVAVSDIDEDGIKYRVINIPVDPESPSKAKFE